MTLQVTQSTRDPNPIVKWKTTLKKTVFMQKPMLDHCVYAEANVDPLMFGIENKPINVAVLSDVSDSLSQTDSW